MTGATESRVTVVGLGAMGRALAGALLAAGHPTTVWNRTAGRADQLVADGAVLAETVSEAVSASPLVLLCLQDAASVRQVLAPAAGSLAGRVLVNLTTSTPPEERALADWADRQDVAGYLDGGIMAVPSLIGQPASLVLYSGPRSVYARHEPVLAALGTGHYVGPDPGVASLLDLALLAGMYGMFGGFLQAVALAGTGSVPASEFTSSLLIPWLQAMTGALPELADQIDREDYAAEESTLLMQTSGVDLVEFSEEQGISGALLAPMFALMRRRVEQGHGQHDLSSLIELIRDGGESARRHQAP